MNNKHKIISHIIIGLLLFACGYILLNYTQLLYKVYYRYASAHDMYSAVRNFTGFLVQGALLLIVCIFFQKKMLVLILAVVALSAFVHLSYEQILGGYIDADVMSWLLSETRQATNALGEFLPAFVVTFIRVAALIILFIFSRKLLRPLIVSAQTTKQPSGLVAIVSSLAVVMVPGEMLRLVDLPQSNETSAYTLATHVLLATDPQRATVDGHLSMGKPLVNKIVWLVDESISAQGASIALTASVQHHRPVDFGEVSSMGNCSAPSNAALRWGVNVMKVSPRSDLRTVPPIWAYAKQAGYSTTLIDGQVSGAPQNMVWEPERALIDSFVPAKDGIDTDLKIAEKVNVLLNRPGLDFIYVVLRGAHYAYESNYPKNLLSSNSTLLQKYVEAIRYSKQGFFEALFLDVDRNQIAAIYTSDHGQHLEEGKVPHCTLQPSADEYSVPLLAFFPEQAWSYLKMPTDTDDLTGRSHSQIFSTTLWLMGYDQRYAEENYDALLNKPTNRYVWFGRSFAPNSNTGIIELHTSDKFPMR